VPVRLTMMPTTMEVGIMPRIIGIIIRPAFVGDMPWTIWM
jgi:hypothetical protein